MCVAVRRRVVVSFAAPARRARPSRNDDRISTIRCLFAYTPPLRIAAVQWVLGLAPTRPVAGSGRAVATSFLGPYYLRPVKLVGIDFVSCPVPAALVRVAYDGTFWFQREAGLHFRNYRSTLSGYIDRTDRLELYLGRQPNAVERYAGYPRSHHDYANARRPDVPEQRRGGVL